MTKVEWVYHLGICESTWTPGLKHLDSNKKYSYGVLQFQMATWLAYGKYVKANAQNIYNPALQAIVAMKMLDAGENYHWKTCSAKVTKKFGKYPK